ncbi:MAG: alpha/beta hydrolase fold domain-containing protein [Streptosporangiales bacterium]|nr:alpha/beta hydrolase fold domain-containing protein [Streptosporangiales bacterium]
MRADALVRSCHVRMSAIRSRHFRSPLADPTLWDMTDAIHTTPDELRLRGRAGVLRTDVYRPDRGNPGGPTEVVILFADPGTADAYARYLCPRVRCVVVVPALALSADDAMAVTGWVADHAAELDADPRRLVVVGTGTGTRPAAAVVRRAGEDGWPPLAAHVLVDAALGEADLVARLREALAAGLGRSKPVAWHGRTR